LNRFVLTGRSGAASNIVSPKTICVTSQTVFVRPCDVRKQNLNATCGGIPGRWQWNLPIA